MILVTQLRELHLRVPWAVMSIWLGISRHTLQQLRQRPSEPSGATKRPAKLRIRKWLLPTTHQLRSQTLGCTSTQPIPATVLAPTILGPPTTNTTVLTRTATALPIRLPPAY